MSKFDGLIRLLRQHRNQEFVLTFPEIEAAIGEPLPKSAQRPQYWENPTSPEHTIGVKRAVREAGCKSFLLAGQDKVRFTRN